MVATVVIIFAIVIIVIISSKVDNANKQWINSCAANCPSDLIKTIPTKNPGITLGLLFEHDGCSIYRFRDGSPLTKHYYIKCNNAAGQIQ